MYPILDSAAHSAGSEPVMTLLPTSLQSMRQVGWSAGAAQHCSMSAPLAAIVQWHCWCCRCHPGCALSTLASDSGLIWPDFAWIEA